MIHKLKIFNRIFYSALTLAIVVTTGSLGFMLIEGYTFVESLYMTVITVSTVGFGEVRPLSPSGMLFTSMLIITSIGTFAYTISVMTTYFVAGEYKNLFKSTLVEKRLEKLSGHVIVCGYGRVGEMACSELVDHHQEILVLETAIDKINGFPEDKRIVIVEGDATKDENLIRAGIHRAKAIITTLPHDADNLYVVLTARELNKNLVIISRASQTESCHKLRIAGATNVIMPDKVGGAQMASLVVNPDVIEFLDHIRIQGGSGINLEEIQFDDLPDNFRYKTLGEIQQHNRFGINIIGYKAEGDYVINPGPETRILPKCKLFVLGNPDQIRLLNRILGIQTSI